MQRTSTRSSDTIALNHQLAEVWGDIVDLRHLAGAVAIGAAVSLGCYFITGKIFATFVADPQIAHAYAMLAGLMGCVASGIVSARLFPPKREVVESAADETWRAEAMDLLAKETGDIGDTAGLPPEVIAEMKSLKLYDVFVAYEAEAAAREADDAVSAPTSTQVRGG